MLSAIILEDEVLAQERLKLLLKECRIAVLNSFFIAADTLNWLQQNEVDIIFIDIGLPEQNGIEFALELRKLSKKQPYIIFTTAFDRFAIDAFNLAATDYLLKPIRINRLQQALAKIPQYYQQNEDEFHFFKIQMKNEILKLPWQQASHLVAEDKIVLLYSIQNKVYELPKTLIFWEQNLGNKVIRVHRNALVMKHMLESLIKIKTKSGSKWHAKINNSNTVLPVSRRQLSLVLKKLYEENRKL